MEVNYRKSLPKAGHDKLTIIFFYFLIFLINAFPEKWNKANPNFLDISENF